MAKLIFQHHYSASSVSHDPPKIISICQFSFQETPIVLLYLIYIIVDLFVFAFDVV